MTGDFLTATEMKIKFKKLFRKENNRKQLIENYPRGSKKIKVLNVDSFAR